MKGIVPPSAFITPSWLIEQHIGLTRDEAHLLYLFCLVHTIRYKECYGDGSVMFPLWCAIMDNIDREIKSSL